MRSLINIYSVMLVLIIINLIDSISCDLYSTNSTNFFKQLFFNKISYENVV